MERPHYIPTDLGQIAPEILGKIGSDFVAHMVEAAEDYCIQKAIEAVRAGFSQGYSESDGGPHGTVSTVDCH